MAEDPDDLTDAAPQTGHETRRERRSAPIIQPKGGFAAEDLLGDRYRIVRLIAHGGMGEVYEALDLELRSSVALKTIRPELATEAMAERFRRELYLARQVTHPNVCRLFDLGRHRASDGSEVLFLTMELLGGETLSKLLKRAKKLSIGDALPIVRQIASAIDAAHIAGIVHRDLKPGNVMLVPPREGSDEVRAIVTDFGVAHGTSDPFDELSGTGDVVGSPAYMAPEQIEGAEPTPAADIYALGIVIYEMVTGVRPFQGESSLSAVLKRLKADPPPPRQHVPDLDPTWEAVILRCLARDPANRFASGDEVVRALTAGALVEAPRRRWPALAGAVAAIGLGGAGIWAVTHRPSDAPATASSAATSGRRSVAVFGFKNLSSRPDAAWLSTAITETISIDLGSSKQLRTVSGEEIARSRNDLGLVEAESYSAESLTRIRGRLGADLVIVGSYLALGADKSEQVRLNLRVQDTRSGETVSQISDVATIGELAALVARVDVRVRGQLGIDSASRVDEVATRAALPQRPEALRLYSEGLAKLRLFDAAAARSLLVRAAELEPDQPMIHAVLAETWTALGYDRNGQEEAKRAHELASVLPNVERRLVEARYRETANQWELAIAIYRSLATEFPDDLEHGLRLASAQVQGQHATDAAATIAVLRTLPVPKNDDPRIDLVDASAAYARGELARAEQAGERAATKALKIGARLLVAQGRLAQGRAANYQGKVEASVVAHAEARDLFAAAGDRGNESRAINNMAVALMARGEQAKAEKLFEQVVALQREVGNLKGMSAALLNLALNFQERGDLARSEELSREALKHANETGDRERAALILNNLADVKRVAGEPDAGLALIDEARMARVADDLRNEALIFGTRGQLSTLRGELETARADLEQGIAICRKSNALSDLADQTAWLADNWIEIGDFATARRLLDDAVKHQKELNQIAGLARSKAIDARLALAEHRFDDAERAAMAAATELHRIHAGYDELQALITLARARIALRRPADARTALEQAVALKLQGRFAELVSAIVSAEIDAASGRRTAAAKGFARVRDGAAKAHLARLEFEARLGLARSSGDRKALDALAKDATAAGMLRIAREAGAR